MGSFPSLWFFLQHNGNIEDTRLPCLGSYSICGVTALRLLAKILLWFFLLIISMLSSRYLPPRNVFNTCSDQARWWLPSIERIGISIWNTIHLNTGWLLITISASIMAVLQRNRMPTVTSSFVVSLPYYTVKRNAKLYCGGKETLVLPWVNYKSSTLRFFIKWTKWLPVNYGKTQIYVQKNWQVASIMNQGHYYSQWKNRS